MGEAGTDLAGSDEVVVRPARSPTSKIRSMPRPHSRQALLDAVDARFVQEASDPVDPTAATAEVSFEAESLGDLAPEVCRSVQLAAIDTEPVSPGPMGEALLVAAGEVGGGCESVEILDVELGQRRPRRAAARRRPSGGVTGRSSLLDRSDHADQSCLPLSGGQPKKARSVGLRSGTSRSRRWILSKRYRRVPGLDCLVVLWATKRGVFPLGGPPAAARQHCSASPILPSVISTNDPGRRRRATRSPATGAGHEGGT